MNITDCHTHNLNSTNAIINVSLGTNLLPGKIYSIGVHPWESEKGENTNTNDIINAAISGQVVAIGETGIDMLRGGDFKCQKELFIKHIEASESVGKPIILHVVKAWQYVIEIRKELKAKQMWVAHGFRGKPELAMDLIRHGIGISLGEKYNEATAKIIPDDYLFAETDESVVGIDEIIMSIAGKKGVSKEMIDNVLSHNMNRTFKGK